ncbi:unnamed protein product, partial [Rotaria sp. Silwood1]
MAHLLVENLSSSSSNNRQITSASSCHWALESCTLTDPKVIALVCFEQSNYAVHLHPKDKRGYRSIVRLINNDQIFSTINRDYTSVERIGLALTMALVTEAYNHIVPIAQNAVTGNNARLLDPKTVTIQLSITQEPIFLHGHVFGCGDPERKYIDDVQLDGPILGTLFNMNTSSPSESDHDKKVSWKSDEINKVVRRLETEIENIHHAYKIHGLTVITRNTFFNIYIVRHGETDWNTQKRLQGHTDIALSAKGKLQACQLQEKFAGIHFSKVFSSDLIRARSTAELILGSNKSTINETPLLRERCLGTWEGRFAGELKSHLEQTIDVDNFTQEEYLSFKWDDTAESYSDAYQRLQTFIRSIAFSTPISDDPILLCSHGEEQCNRNQTLILLHEQNIRDSLYYENERNESNIPDAFETSGVVLRPDTLIMYIIFDNTFQIGVFCTWLAIRTINCTNKLLDWPDNTFNKLNSEFEGIAYNSLTDTYFIVQETISSNVSSNEYNSNIFEVQITTNVTFSSINLIQSCRINWTFESTSKGFEGLEFMMHHKRNKNYLLALCEGNKCKPQSNSEDPVTSLGNGKLVVLDKHETTHNNSCQWVSVGIINLPFDIKFRDYSAISAYKQNTSTYIAVTSQVNSQVWIGIIEEIDQNPYFRITSSNKTGVYNLPRTIVNGSMCAKEYCNIEGVAWINENQLILVSDLAKKSHGVLCFRKDESIHYFSLPNMQESMAIYPSYCSTKVYKKLQKLLTSYEGWPKSIVTEQTFIDSVFIIRGKARGRSAWHYLMVPMNKVADQNAQQSGTKLPTWIEEHY